MSAELKKHARLSLASSLAGALLLFAAAVGAAGCASPPSIAERAPAATPPAEKQATRHLEFHYEATISPGDKTGAVDLYLPIAQSTPEQEVISVDVESPLGGEFGTEATYGNRYWHAHLEQLPAKPLTVRVVYRRTSRRASRSAFRYPLIEPQARSAATTAG